MAHDDAPEAMAGSETSLDPNPHDAPNGSPEQQPDDLGPSVPNREVPAGARPTTTEDPRSEPEVKNAAEPDDTAPDAAAGFEPLPADAPAPAGAPGETHHDAGADSPPRTATLDAPLETPVVAPAAVLAPADAGADALPTAAGTDAREPASDDARPQPDVPGPAEGSEAQETERFSDGSNLQPGGAAPPSSPAFRSRQPTLAMGGNVNGSGYREHMPTLREVAEEYIEHAPALARHTPTDSEPAQERLSMTELAQQALAITRTPHSDAPHAALPVPEPGDDVERPVDVASHRSVPPPVTPNHASSGAEPWRSAVFPTPAPPPVVAAPTLPALANVSWSSAPGASVPAATPTTALAASSTPAAALGQRPETFTPQALDTEPEPTTLRSSPLSKLRSLGSRLPPGQRAGALLGAVVLALGGGFWIGSLSQDDEAASAEAPVPDPEPAAAAAQAAVASADPSEAEEPTPRSGAALAPPSTEPTAEPPRDERFAVRTQLSAPSCDTALGKPFQAAADPHAGKAGQYWSRSRKSLLRGRQDQALEQMCLSAHWDLAGRGTYGLSEYYFKLADFTQALTWAERVPSDSRRHGDARTMIGDLYSQQGRVQDALAVYLDKWNIAADDQGKRDEFASRFIHSAASARLKGDWWTAERYYRRALTLNPKDPLAAAGLARSFVHFEFYDAAASWAEHALDLDGESVQAAIALSEAYVGAKDRTRAQAAIQRLREVSPSSPQLRLLERRSRELD